MSNSTTPSVVTEKIQESLHKTLLYKKSGRVCYASGPLIRAVGNYSIGEICKIGRSCKEDLLAEVVGFNGGEALLTPFGTLDGVSYYSKIIPIMPEFQVPVGDELTGRVLDGMCAPMDGKPSLITKIRYPSNALPPDPMERPLIDSPFVLGIRALDGTLTCGEGQRMGIFAAAGGGKTTLLSMLVRFARCDTCVVALIGERGREVREFVEYQLGAEGLAKSVVIVATSDRPAIEQVQAAYTATAIAEYYRDQGKKVLLLMDSLTRFARAQRQIGLSAGEPPTRRGFPPSVFERLPALVERAGKSARGSITALYTVLVEGDDMNEPVADETRSLLDGHIILSRKLAGSGHYPAIDVIASASRVLNSIASNKHVASITKLRELLSKYNEVELLVRIGEYKSGSDHITDEAIQRKPQIDAFLKQDISESVSFDETINLLHEVVGHA